MFVTSLRRPDGGGRASRALVLAAACAAALLAGCASVSRPADGAAELELPSDHMVASLADEHIVPFSGAAPGGPWPPPWSKAILAPAKKRTRYDLVRVDGRTVLRARADASASGLQKTLDLDPRQRPMLEWSWRVHRLIPGADLRDRFAEDSPVRVILAFDGDKSTLPVKDRMLFERARLLTGRELPYATLMYVWENRAPIETVVENPHTDRVRKIVVASGADELGRWHQFRRDIVADYRRAFGAEPGRLIAVGVMTDTDNTGESTEAYYGDLRLLGR